MARWRCGVCGRSFAREGQTHSCASGDLDAFFAKHEPLRPLFDRLAAGVARFGAVRTEVVKTSIHFAARSAFAGIQLRKDGLRLSFLVDYDIESPRVIARLAMGPTRKEHAVMVRTRADIDAELLRWLRDAHALRA
jgi:hypothetical protein